jgi:tetratricopeptide (TPR) repeat protein
VTVESRLGAPLPPDYRDFLLSWNGVALFQDLITLFGSGDPALVSPAPGRLRIGQAPEGALWLSASGEVRLVDEVGPDPLVCGTTLERYFAATLAREALILDRQGEFREVFDEEGAIVEAVRKKRVLAGRKHDPQASLYLVEEAELLLEGHEQGPALAALLQAVAHDPEAGPAFELLAALHRDAGRREDAEQESLRAAAATTAPALRASRLLDAALFGPAERAGTHAAAAWAADPEHAALLLVQSKELLAEGDKDEAAHLADRLRLLLAHQPGRPDAGLRPTPPVMVGLEELAQLDRELRTRAALRVV